MPATRIDRAGEQPRGDRERHLEREPEEEDRPVEQERQLARVGEALDVLLDDERRDGGRRERPRPRRARPARDREREEDGQREHREQLRQVREVAVDALGRRSGDAIRDRVRDERPGRGERHGQAEHEGEPPHAAKCATVRDETCSGRTTRPLVRQ